MIGQDKKAASDVLQGVVDNHHEDLIALGQIKDVLHERGFGILMIIFSLPLCIPVPAPPGLTLLPSLPLLFFSFQMIIGKSAPWLPKWIASKQLKRTTLAMLVQKANPWLKKIEKLLKSRFAFASSKRGERVVGIFCFICSLSITNPVPGSNLVPAIGISLMSLGLVSKDGIVIVIGMLVGMVGVLIGLALLFAVITGTSSIFHWF